MNQDRAGKRFIGLPAERLERHREIATQHIVLSVAEISYPLPVDKCPVNLRGEGITYPECQVQLV